ncbi:MAG: AAA family ATPase [bacterium]|nr:AAA family ATPase [bacterium]
MDLNTYLVHETVYASDSTRVFRATEKASSRRVIIKQIQAPRASLISRLRREFNLVRLLDSDAVVEALSFEDDLDLPAIVFDDFGGVALSEIFARRGAAWPLAEFFPIATRLAQILKVIHNRGIIHQDVKPGNLIFNTETNELRLTDFGIAVRRDGAFGMMPSLRMRGTLAYMAPEQSGRMNRAIDQRADLYSLGVILYEALCGRLPFEISADALEMIHRHIAVRPADPHSINPQVPEALSGIVMKLLAKDAEDRYQSANGLLNDLEEIQRLSRTAGAMLDFSPGARDVSDLFVVSRKLYGRENEKAALTEAFRRTLSGAREFYLVRGFAGIGKSSVVYSVQDAVLESRGFFVSGKFDQFQLGIPYSAILQAFRQLISEILKGEAGEVAAWKSDMLAALGTNGQVIAEVIPEIERIIGPQPAPIAVGPEESENRFINVFQDFVRSLARPENPLVLFVDDLHWADPASLRLLRVLLEAQNLGYLMIIGAYRDNEVAADHPLEAMIDALRERDYPPGFVEVRALDANEINRMVSATLQAPENETRVLGDFIHQKGGGNPFFVREFLQILHRDGHIRFDAAEGRWVWDAALISKLPAPDKIGALMVHKIQYLDEETREALQFAACMGNRFERTSLAAVLQKNDETVEAILRPALREGLLSPLLPGSDARVGDQESTLEFAEADGHYQFQHDRVQQAVYDSIEASQKESRHLRIARELIRGAGDSESALDECIFSIVHHLDAAGDSVLSADPGEGPAAASLYRRAARRALDSAAYQASAASAKRGLELLPTGREWSEFYYLARTLRELRAEAEHLCSHNELCIRIVEEILEHVSDPLDRTLAYEIRLRALTALGEIEGVIAVALEALASLGYVLPAFPGRLRVRYEVLRVQWLIFRKGVESILSAPATSDPFQEAALRIFPLCASATYKVRQNLWALSMCKYVELSYRYGWTSASPYGLASLGGILLHIRRFGASREIGRVALLLEDQVGNNDHFAKTMFAYGGLFIHCFESFEDNFELLKSGSRRGMEAGDIEYAGYCHLYYCVHAFYSSGQLPDLESQLATQYHLINNFRNENVQRLNRIYYQLVLNLRHESEAPHRMDGKIYSEDEGLRQLDDGKYISAVVIHHGACALLRYLFGRMESALEAIEAAQELVDYVPAMYFGPLDAYLEALIRFALYDPTQRGPARETRKRIRELLRYFKGRTKLNPAIYAHKLQLLQAEQDRILGRHDRAVRNYTAAIQLAHDRGYFLDEAIACELAGEFYLSQNNQRIARTYLEEARSVYRRWGADVRVRFLEEKHPEFFAGGAAGSAQPSRETLESTIAFATRSEAGALDIETVTKAVQMLFAGQNAAAVMEEFLRLSVENAGAERGALVLHRGEELWLEALRDASATESEFRAQRFESYTALPREIINYVLHTGEPVVLGSAFEEGAFTADPYVRRSRCKSILAAPIVYDGDVRGVLYLENRQAANVLTRPRLQILGVLSHQAAVSLENARLYEHMQSEITEKTHQLLNLKLARDRMDPHFLFNSLNMVHALMARDPEQANRALLAVAEMYRTLTDISEAELVDFELEWRFLEEYLNLMRLRYVNSLRIEVSRPKTLPRFQIPPLSLQPIVENSFKHGFRNENEQMQIEIILEATADQVEINFRDNGSGFQREIQPGDTLHTIRERLRHYFPNASLRRDDTVQGSGVIVSISGIDRGLP